MRTLRCFLLAVLVSCSMPLTVAHAEPSTVEQYISHRPGVVGYVVYDRVTGSLRDNTHAHDLIFTASTIKLAMVTVLLQRTHYEHLSLSAQDHHDMDAMLHVSDDEAADRLWKKYNTPSVNRFDNEFKRIGMYGITPRATADAPTPYWGYQQCSAYDLLRLMKYIFTVLNPADQNYLIHHMQNVGEDQQWGIWSLGPAWQPGNKDGWSDESTGSIANTVGFAGPNHRYLIAIMNSLNGKGTIRDGQETVSTVAKLLLQ